MPETIEVKQVSEVRVFEEAPTEVSVQVVSEVVPEASDIDQALQELSPYVPAYVASVRDRIARGENVGAVLQEVLDVLSAVRGAVRAREDLLRARAVVPELVSAGVAGAAVDEASRIIDQSIDNVENAFSRLSKATTADEVKGIAKEAAEASGRGLEALKAVRSLVANLISRLAEALTALKTQFNLSRPISDLRAAAQAVLSAASGAEILAAWSLKRAVENLYSALKSLEGLELPKEVVSNIQALIDSGRYADAIGEISKGVETAKKLNELRGKITEALKGLEELEAYVKSVVERLEKLGIEDLEKLLQEVQRVREIYGRVVELRKKAEDLIARIEATIPQEARGGVRDQLADIRKRIFETVAKLKKASTPEEVEAVEKDLATAVEELQKLYTQRASQTLENLRKALEEAWERARKILETAARYREMLGQDPSQALENLKKRYEELRKRLEDIATGKSQEDVENLRKDIDSFIKDAGAEAENTAKALTNIYGRISERAKKLAELAREVATPLGMQIPEIPPPPTAAGEIAQALENLTKTETQILDILKKAMLQRIDTLINTYSNRPEAWAPTAVEILREMRSVVETWNTDQALMAAKGYLAQLQRIEDLSKKAFYNTLASYTSPQEKMKYIESMKALRELARQACSSSECPQPLATLASMSDSDIEKYVEAEVWAKQQVGLLVLNPRESALVKYLAVLYTTTPEVFNTLAGPIKGTVLKALRGEDLTDAEMASLIMFLAANKDVVERVLNLKQADQNVVEKLVRGEEPQISPAVPQPVLDFLKILSLQPLAEQLERLLSGIVTDPRARSAIVGAIMGAGATLASLIPGVGPVVVGAMIAGGVGQLMASLADPVLRDLMLQHWQEIAAAGAAGVVASIATALLARNPAAALRAATANMAQKLAEKLYPSSPWLAEAILKVFSQAKTGANIRISRDLVLYGDEENKTIWVATKEGYTTIKAEPAVMREMLAIASAPEDIKGAFIAWVRGSRINAISRFERGVKDPILESYAKRLGISLDDFIAASSEDGRNFIAFIDKLSGKRLKLEFDNTNGLSGALDFIKLYAGRGVGPEELNPLLQRLFNTELKILDNRFSILSTRVSERNVIVKLLDTANDREIPVRLRSTDPTAGQELIGDLNTLRQLWRDLGSPGSFEAFAEKIFTAAWKTNVSINAKEAAPAVLMRIGDDLKIVMPDRVVSTTIDDVAKTLLTIKRAEEAGFDPVLVRTILEIYADSQTVKAVASAIERFLRENTRGAIGRDIKVIDLARGRELYINESALKLFRDDPLYAHTLLASLSKPKLFGRVGRDTIQMIELSEPELAVLNKYGVRLEHTMEPRTFIKTLEDAEARAVSAGASAEVSLLRTLRLRTLFALSAYNDRSPLASPMLLREAGRGAVIAIPIALDEASAERTYSSLEQLRARGIVSIEEITNTLGSLAQKFLTGLRTIETEEGTTIASKDISTATIYNVESIEKPVQTAVEIPVGLRATVIEEPETITSVDLAVASIYGAEEITKPLPQSLVIPTPLRVVVIEEPETIVSRDYLVTTATVEESVEKPVQRVVQIPVRLRVVEVEEPETMALRDHLRSAIYMQEEIEKQVQTASRQDIKLKTVEVEEPAQTLRQAYITQQIYSEEPAQKSVADTGVFDVYLVVVPVPGTKVTYVPEEEGRPPPPAAVGVSPAAPIPPALGGAQLGPQQIMPRGKGVREGVVV